MPDNYLTKRKDDDMSQRDPEHHAMKPTEPYGEQAGFWVQPEEAEARTAALAFQPTFYDVDSLPSLTPIPGITMSVMVGGNVMMNWVRIEPGVSVPAHAHEHEQDGLVLEGEIIMTIGDETRTLRPGHAYTIPGNLSHGATAGPAGCLVLDVFNPPRADYIAAAK
jgi:quercetin dioxygenase-like cupin family protein